MDGQELTNVRSFERYHSRLLTTSPCVGIARNGPNFRVLLIQEQVRVRVRVRVRVLF